METLKRKCLEDLREARQQLLKIKKVDLTFNAIDDNWLPKWISTFERSESLSSNLILINIDHRLAGYSSENDPEILSAVRERIVEILDSSIQAIDLKQHVKPILEEHIQKIEDTKLSTLLKEFNDAKDSSPNLAAIGFRTIVALIVIEKAKLCDPDSDLAQTDDINPDPIIKKSLRLGIFTSGESKHLKRFLEKGKKDVFDNVVHKPKVLVDKEDLDYAVLLLNSLLPAIIE